jgi:putative transposase
MSLVRLSHRESWWKDAEILMLRHQLAVAQRQRPRVHVRLTWPDRAWMALLAGTLPIERLAGMRLTTYQSSTPLKSRPGQDGHGCFGDRAQ